MILSSTPAPTVRSFPVLLSERTRVEAALAALAKRCARRGLTMVKIAWGKAYTTREHRSENACTGPDCRGCLKIARVELTLTGEAPRYAGWTLAAALTHVEGETVVRSHGDVPAMYRTRGSVCDHCHTKRNRAETYLVHHEDGRWLQVGSDCLTDFLGNEDAEKIAQAASVYFIACGCAEDGCEESGGGRSDHLTLDEYLPMVAWCVREIGWVSRTAARERTNATATADQAMTFICNAKARKEAGANPSAADGELAAAAALWAESITDETIAAQTGDYLHNLRVVARAGYVTSKLAGIGASMVTAYERAMGRERAAKERSERPASKHVGTVGNRSSWAATLDFVTGYETDYGYTTVCKFRTGTDGADVLVWKASSTGITRADVGKKYIVTGSVKAHDDYKGQAQTMLSRCDIADFDQAAWDGIQAEERRVALASKVKAGTADAAERAEHEANQAARKAASKAKSARVAARANFECTIYLSHYPLTHEALKIEAPSGTVTIDFCERSVYGAVNASGIRPTVWAPYITVRHGANGRLNKCFEGDKAFDKARKFVAELLAEVSS